MAIKIQKVKVSGKYIYAATILEAVKQATAGTNYGKTLAEIIGHPKQTVGDTEYAATGLYKAIIDGDAASVQAFKDLAGELKIDDTTYTTIKAYADAVAAKEAAAAKSGAEATAKAITGELSSLNTTAKGTLVAAINELVASIASNDVSLSVKETANEGYLKTYVLSKGSDNTLIGEIDIPKDLVVTSGSVITATAEDTGCTVGDKYIKLVIANQTTPLYIAVKDLYKDHTAQKNATQVQLVISDSNEISATIVAKSIGATELSDAVNASLAKADSAVQTIATGSANGNISVDGTNVPVKGLGSAAFTESNAYDPAGTAQGIVDALGGSKEGSSNGVKVTVSTSKGEVSGVSVEAPDFAATYDAIGAAATAKSEVIGASTDAKTADTVNGAKAFATDAVSTLENGQVKTNKEAIEALLGKESDTKDSVSIVGAKKYADSIVAAALVVENIADTTDYAEVW